MPVNSTHGDYKRMLDRWQRCRDAMCGQDAVHAAGEAYLPKLSEQKPDEYSAYVKRAPFYNATWRTIVGLKGMLLRKPPKIEVPPAVEEYLDDVTLSGVPMKSFIGTVCEEALGLGRLGILVDYPEVNVVGLTLADAQRLNLRPTMQLYKAESVINWRQARIKNKMMLTLVVLKECEGVAKDEFETVEVEQYRVLELLPIGDAYRYRVQVWRKKTVAVGSIADQWEIIGEAFPQMNSAPLDYIPFVFIGTDDVTPEVDDPPLIDLVNVNLSHYRTTADYEHGAHFTGLPTPYVTGYVAETTGEKFYVGSQTAWAIKNENAKVGYLEFTGTGLTTLKDILASKEQQMAVLGARMLEPQKKSAESPDSASIRRKGEESMLADVAQVISQGLAIALRWWVEWANADPGAVEVELNRDFYPAAMTADMLNALVSAWQASAMITDEELFTQLQEGEIISAEADFEETKQALADRGPVLSGGLPPGTAPGLPPEPGVPIEKTGVAA